MLHAIPPQYHKEVNLTGFHAGCGVPDFGWRDAAGVVVAKASATVVRLGRPLVAPRSRRSRISRFTVQRSTRCRGIVCEVYVFIT